MAIECLILGNSLKRNKNSSFFSGWFKFVNFFLFFCVHSNCLIECVSVVLDGNDFDCSGAGQEVGKSCAVVKINGKRIMFDCGMHMGYHDHRRYPDFSLISPDAKDFTSSLSCIIITHL